MSNARFSILQARAVKDKRISNSQFRTLAALGMYADEDGWCFPRQSTVGKDLGKSRQAINRDIQALKELGYLDVKPQYKDDGSQRANLYRLVYDFDGGGETPALQGVKHSYVTGGETQLRYTITTHNNDPNKQEEEGKAFAAFENNISPLTPMIGDELGDMIDEHTAQWVIAAIKEAAMNGKRNIKYINAILKRWKVEGYGTSLAKNNSKKPESGKKTREQIIAEVAHGN